MDLHSVLFASYTDPGNKAKKSPKQPVLLHQLVTFRGDTSATMHKLFLIWSENIIELVWNNNNKPSAIHYCVSKKMTFQGKEFSCNLIWKVKLLHILYWFQLKWNISSTYIIILMIGAHTVKRKHSNIYRWDHWLSLFMWCRLCY